MNALELADEIDADTDVDASMYFDASAMLRRQHKAIVNVRAELVQIQAEHPPGSKVWFLAEQALNDTKEFQ